MDEIEVMVKLSVFYEEPYWVGLFEKQSQGKYSVCRVVFGPEPRIDQILQLIYERYHELKFSLPHREKSFPAPGTMNPKRRQRAIAHEMAHIGRSTRAQEALQEQREALKLERRQVSSKEKEEAARQKYILKQLKKKDKKKGH
ncbi:MAG TPA: YjdF family protein [Syntrophomonadaceae bacterium]|nr:YjdF family protein [Syntrophomonadaceae bacterium]